MQVKRCEYNPLLTPADVKPSRPDFRVDGVFNIGRAHVRTRVTDVSRTASSA